MEEEVTNIEDSLGKEAESNIKEVREMCKEFGDSMGCMNMVGVWKHVEKLNPKSIPTLPVAKINSNGTLVKNTHEVKELLFNICMFHIRHRPLRPDLHKLQQFRERLVQIRLDICKKRTSPPWSKHNFCVELKSKKKTCRQRPSWMDK